MNNPRYKKRVLSDLELYNGFMLAAEQADQLIEEASILKDNGKYAGAFSKIILALEEIGKNRIVFFLHCHIRYGIDVNWKFFWKQFYSHQSKLNAVFLWVNVLNEIPIPDKETFYFYREKITKIAKDMDARKQTSQYSGIDEEGFRKPKDIEFKGSSEFFIKLARELMKFIRHEFEEEIQFETYLEKVDMKARYTAAMGFFESQCNDDIIERITEVYSPVMVRDGIIPSDEDFLERVKDRYKIYPQVIPVTLDNLNNSKEFKEFFLNIQKKYGYPEWIILSVIYNITLNERMQIDPASIYEDRSKIMNWKESEEEAPLPVSIYTDERRFNSFLNGWLNAFMAGLGVSLDLEDKCDASAMRRVAAYKYGIFDRDVEHDKVFHFNGVDNN